jgi:hypothetical protein
MPKRKAKAPKAKRTRSKAPKSTEIVNKTIKSPKKPMGRPRLYDKEAAGDRHRAAAAKYNADASFAARDIANPSPNGKSFDPTTINWERRLACARNLRLFCETYCKNIFYLGWSDDQLRCIKKAETAIIESGMFALAMPRGNGKTAICRAAIIWCTAYAYRTFPFFIGSSQEKANQTLEAIRKYWSNSPDLLQDFPEIAYPIARLENRNHMARGQLFMGQSTFVDWGTERIQYPCLLLPSDLAETYLFHHEDSLLWLPGRERFMHKSGGIVIATAGIDGSIRGEAEIHPILLTQPRPDIVLLDDVQKDQRADSPASCEKLIRLIDGTVQGLAGPGKTIAALMPCTVIRDGDVSDTYLNRGLKPEWKGERCQLVTSWPEGLTDTTISLETEAGKHWNRYADLRHQSLRRFEDLSLANDYYAIPEHRAVMDAGFVCSWPERYDKAKELSPQQHAMNLRLTNPLTFPAEYQNIGRKLIEDGIMLVTAAQVAEKTIAVEEFHCPVDTHYLVGHIDVQNEILFLQTFACAPDFTGLFNFYGTWPDVPSRYFRKTDTEGWSLLTREFFKRYPEHRDKAWKTEGGKTRAPIEAKIYFALHEAVNFLKSLPFIKDDGFGTPIRMLKIGIDTRWGQLADCIKRFCRECGHPEVVPYHGHGISPTQKQIEEFTRTKGSLFEDQVNPQVKEVKWVYRPDASGQYHLMCDVNRMKDFLMARLASPPGSPGGISLYNGSPDHHELFSHHLCNSEYPEPVIACGRKKNMWKEREGRPDNDYLDTSVACLALASMSGAYLRTEYSKAFAPSATVERKLSSVWAKKRQG